MAQQGFNIVEGVIIGDGIGHCMVPICSHGTSAGLLLGEIGVHEVDFE